MKILISGGGGYIGSHVANELNSLGYEYCVFDNNLNKMQTKLPYGSDQILGDIKNYTDLESVFKKHQFSHVIHLAALKSVKDSEEFPAAYYETNVVGTRNLILAMETFGVTNLIFSSTAAVYGETTTGVVYETSELNPISHYGKTKVDCELMIAEAEERFGLRFINLRYFNVAGCLNHRLKDESRENLIPAVVNQVRNGKRPKIFGHDYHTHDGTAVRDFVHVSDIVRAHLTSLDYLSRGGTSDTFNIGTGLGTSVLEIVAEIISQLDSNLKPEFLGRRKGDIGIVVADSSKVAKSMGFKTQFNLSQMIASIL